MLKLCGHLSRAVENELLTPENCSLPKICLTRRLDKLKVKSAAPLRRPVSIASFAGKMQAKGNPVSRKDLAMRIQNAKLSAKLLMAALLASGLAYGGNPSANLSGQVVPAGSDPPVPAEAEAAGLTTLVADYDFSQPQYATQSNWLDCTGTNSALPWHYGTPGTPPWQLPPCNINQTTDPVTGQTVLNVQWLESYGSNKFLIMCNCLNGTTYVDYPNFYVETVLRIDNASSPFGAPFALGAVWSGQDFGGSYELPSGIELDYVELANGSGGVFDAAVHNWGNLSRANNVIAPGDSNNLPSGYTVTSYHKYGMLFTSDGTTASYACSFVDDFNQGCISTATLSSPNQYLWRNYLLVSNGSNDGAAPDTAQYIQYIRVWSCANWALPAGQTPMAASMCSGSTLFQGDQNGRSLTYWY